MKDELWEIQIKPEEVKSTFTKVTPFWLNVMEAWFEINT